MYKKLWSSADGETFYSVDHTVEVLPSGIYSIYESLGRTYFALSNYEISNLIKFEDTNIDKAVKEISTFWGKEAVFQEYGIPFRRGLLLYGPPGSGKSCAAKLILQEAIANGGIGLIFNEIYSFMNAMKELRSLQKDTPVVVLMEDLDSILRINDNSAVLNMLDGIGGYEKTIYLATTNYPENLEARIKNRPSRFDKRYFIGFPNDNSRRTYLESLMARGKVKPELDVEQWVKDSNNMTFAHLKELFTSVVVFGNAYDESLKTVIEMKANISSDDYEEDPDALDPEYEADRS